MLEHEGCFIGGGAIQHDDQFGKIILQSGRSFFDDWLDEVKDRREICGGYIRDHWDQGLNAI